MLHFFFFFFLFLHFQVKLEKESICLGLKKMAPFFLESNKIICFGILNSLMDCLSLRTHYSVESFIAEKEKKGSFVACHPPVLINHNFVLNFIHRPLSLFEGKIVVAAL